MKRDQSLLLVSPKPLRPGLSDISFFRMPPIGLHLLRNMTPIHWDVRIVDEVTSAIDFNREVDLVGITAMTALAPRAYEIAHEFRRRNVPVIMGGIHASMLPNEAAQHVDCVVTGEADLMWQSILDDFEAGILRPMYRATMPASLDFPVIRNTPCLHTNRPSPLLPWSLNFCYIQTQRGCPHRCEFCSVSTFNGSTVRTKPISHVIREIEAGLRQSAEMFLFIDDNILGNVRYAKELFHAITPFKIRWGAQTDIRIADDGILDLACESGLFGVFLGLESISSASLGESISATKKRWRPKYEVAIERLKAHGVVIEAGFIFGLDEEPEDAIEKTVAWAITQKIHIAQFSILTPLPGTELFEQYKRTGRIATTEWSRYSTVDCVFTPLDGLTPQELESALRGAYRQFYSWRSCLRRLHRGMDRFQFGISALTNIEFARWPLLKEG